MALLTIRLDAFLNAVGACTATCSREPLDAL